MCEKLLFGVETKEEERACHNVLEQLGHAVDRVLLMDRPEVARLGARAAPLVAWIVEIACAPEESSLGDALRFQFQTHGYAAILIDPEYAFELKDLIRIGLARHEAGVISPENFVLH